jgi:hypothetical protein
MQIDPERIARWRERADEYRVCAEACVSEGAQLAYRALAECADSVVWNAALSPRARSMRR